MRKWALKMGRSTVKKYLMVIADGITKLSSEWTFGKTWTEIISDLKTRLPEAPNNWSCDPQCSINTGYKHQKGPTTQNANTHHPPARQKKTISRWQHRTCPNCTTDIWNTLVWPAISVTGLTNHKYGPLQRTGTSWVRIAWFKIIQYSCMANTKGGMCVHINDTVCKWVSLSLLY